MTSLEARHVTKEAQTHFKAIVGLSRAAMAHEAEAQRIYRELRSIAEYDANNIQTLFKAPGGINILVETKGDEIPLPLELVQPSGNILQGKPGDSFYEGAISRKIGGRVFFIGSTLKLDVQSDQQWVYGYDEETRVAHNGDIQLSLIGDDNLPRL